MPDAVECLGDITENHAEVMFGVNRKDNISSIWCTVEWPFRKPDCLDVSHYSNVSGCTNTCIHTFPLIYPYNLKGKQGDCFQRMTSRFFYKQRYTIGLFPLLWENSCLQILVKIAHTGLEMLSFVFFKTVCLIKSGPRLYVLTNQAQYFMSYQIRPNDFMSFQIRPNTLCLIKSGPTTL